MTLFIGKITLKNSKNLKIELKQKTLGIGYSLANKLTILSGGLSKIKVSKLTVSQNQQLDLLMQKFKGIYDYTYLLHLKILSKIRRRDFAYSYIRFLKGYPVSQRTRSNAKTAARHISTSVKTSSKDKNKSIASFKKGAGSKKSGYNKKNKSLALKLKRMKMKKIKSQKKKLWKKTT